MTKLHLIRHGHAGRRSDWDDDDALRPLSAKGTAQSEAIADALEGEGIDVLWSSAYLRCRQTLEPLAERLGLTVETEDHFTEGGLGPAALEAAIAVVAAGRTLAVSSHGDVIPAVISAAVRRGATLEGPGAPRKGGRYVCEVVDGTVTTIVAHEPPEVTPS